MPVFGAILCRNWLEAEPEHHGECSATSSLRLSGVQRSGLSEQYGFEPVPRFISSGAASQYGLEHGGEMLGARTMGESKSRTSGPGFALKKNCQNFRTTPAVSSVTLLVPVVLLSPTLPKSSYWARTAKLLVNEYCAPMP